ncbi:glycosyltransferase [Acinetobacter nectaris]|uniref:glycosyltransferase n=1 Tax=Acinetobacter nectaris TaxID=1219382 RepID=UPI001F42E6EA|nr:glycosyltransferase [Acinetobacter nectaris]MCF9046963.1 glycosyltransferase [Acinetobacter nectaris]
MKNKPTIAIAMIIKDEANIIKDTLDNLRKYIKDISYFCISDTGSSDNSITIVKDYLKKYHLEGEIYSEKWVNFSTNRNLVLNKCKDKADYILSWDADDRFNGEDKMKYS